MKHLRWIGLLVLFLAVIVVALVRVGSPWSDLKRKHATSEPLPPDAARWQRIAFISAHGRGAFTIGGMSWALRDQSVYLGLPAPLSWFSNGASVPLSAVGGCRRLRWGDGRRETQLWFREAGVAATLRDQDDTVLKWCRAHELPILSSEEFYAELQAQRQAR